MVYELEFKPICKVGENLQFLPKESPDSGFYRVKNIEAIQPIVYDFGPLNAMSWSAEKTSRDINIHLEDWELGQYWVIPLDDIRIKLSMPSAKTRWAIKGQITYVSRIYSPSSLCEFFQWEDDENKFMVYNPTNVVQNPNRVVFLGFRFICERLDSEPDKWTAVLIEGIR